MSGINIDKIADYVQWGFLGLMLLCVVLGLLIGMARGWKKATLAMSMTVLSIFLAAVLAPVFYKLVLNFNLGIFGIDLDGSNTLYGYIEGVGNRYLTEYGVSPDAALMNLVIIVPSIIINLVVFVVLFLIFSLITKLIVYPILKLFFLKKERAARRRNRERGFDGHAPKKRRLIGMGIGAVQGLAVTLALLVPFAAAADTADAAHKALDKDAIAILKDDGGLGTTFADIDALLTKLSDAYRKSVPGAIFSTLNLDKLIYGGLTTIKVDGNKISLEGTALAVAVAANLPLKFGALQKQTDAINGDGTKDAAGKEAACKQLYEEFLDYFRNSFVETIFDSGLAVALIEGAARSVNTAQTAAPAALLDDLGGDGAMGLSVKSIFAELKTNPAAKLKAEMIGLISLIQAVNNDGLLYNLFNMADGFGGVLDVFNYTTSLIPKLNESLKEDDTFLLRELIVLARNTLIDMMGEDEAGGRPGYVSREDIDWEKEAESLFGEKGAFKSLLANYGVLFTDGKINFANAILNETETTALGGAVDDFFSTQLFKDVKNLVYRQYLAEAFSGAAGGILDMSKVDLTSLSFAKLLPVLFRGFDLFTNYAEWMDENYINPETRELDCRNMLADEFGKFIDAVKGLEYYGHEHPETGLCAYPGCRKDPSGIIGQFSRMTEDIFAGMNLSPEINKEYFADPVNQIDIADNKAPIVALIRLSGRVNGMAEIVSSAAAGADHGNLIASQTRIEDIKGSLAEFDAALAQGTPAFRNMTDIFLNGILGSSYGNPVEALIDSCDAYITMLRLLEKTESGGGVGIDTSDITKLIDILYDDEIFRVTEGLLGGKSIDGIVDDNNKDIVESVLADKRREAEANADQNTLDKLDKIAKLLGLNE